MKNNNVASAVTASKETGVNLPLDEAMHCIVTQDADQENWTKSELHD